MKKIIILLFLMSCHLHSIDWNFRMERINIDFNGIVHSGKSIICYGTGSMILSSTDYGETWKQNNIHHDSLDIKQMIFRDNKFFALMNSDYIVMKDNDAENWMSYNINLSGLKSIEANENNIYILADSVIYIFDSQIKLREQIEIHDTNKYSELFIYKDKLLAAGQNGRLFCVDIENPRINEFIDFNVLGLCSDCNSLSGMKEYMDTLYLLEGIHLFQTNNLNDWSIKVNEIRNSNYIINKNTIYELTTDNTEKLISNFFTFYKHNAGVREKISRDDISNNVDFIRLNDYSFINDSLIIGTGWDRLIVKSTDSGINWQLISMFKDGLLYWMNDSTCFSFQSSKGQVFKTENYGLTWLPSKLTDYDVLKCKYPDLIRVEQNGRVFIFDEPKVTNGKNLYFSTDYGKTYSSKRIENIYRSNNYSMISYDNGYLLYSPSKFQTYPFTVIHRLDSMMNYIDRTVIDSIQILEIEKFDNESYVALSLDKHWPYNLVTSSLDSNLYVILRSFDGGLSWVKEFNINMEDTTLSRFIVVDSILLITGLHWLKEPINDTTTIKQLYEINIKSKSIKRIFNGHDSFFDVTPFQDSYIIAGNEFNYENKGRNFDSIFWNKIPFTGYQNLAFINFSDNLWCNVKKVDNPYTTYLINLNFKTPVYIEQDIEIQTKFLNYPAYPNPATNTVRTEIYWDLRHDIEESDIAVYDYKGFRVADRSKITLGYRNTFHGVLSWDCSKFESGVYFIVIKHGDATRSIPIVVSK